MAGTSLVILQAMGKSNTEKIRETTVYRILGGGNTQVAEFILRDRFTFTLLALVLITNLVIICVPITLHVFEKDVAILISYAMAFALIPGYLALLGILLFRWKSVSESVGMSQKLDTGNLRLSHSPKLKNMIVGIQCLLFASLLCSTFILKKQLNSLDAADQLHLKEHVMLEEFPVETLPASILPFLRQCISF